MNPVKQLFRQPLKTLSGVILITLAVAILCVCLGQALTARAMNANLDTLCTSVGLPTEKYLTQATWHPQLGAIYELSSDMPDSIVQWMYDMAQQYPDIIEAVNRPGLASAHIPQLCADHPAAHFADLSSSDPFVNLIAADLNATPHSQVMLEITLETISPDTSAYSLDRFHHQLDAVCVALTGKIESVLGLPQGCTDPTGYTARMNLVLPNADSMDALDLEIGQRYLVYGMDYQDLDWQLRCDVALNGHGISNHGGTSYVDYFYEENWVPFPDGYVEDMGWTDLPEYNVGWYEHLQTYEDGSTRLRGIHLTNLDMLKFRSVAFTLYDLCALDSQTSSKYTLPTIAKVDSSAEAFLESEAGRLWKEYLSYLQINRQSFAVLGVDDLMATGDFAKETATIVAGRNFTEKEMKNGERVCVISEDVALLSGLTIGDQITLHFYRTDEQNPYQNLISQGHGTANPFAYPYGAGAEFAGDGEIYTIVGLYSRNTAWEAPSAYSFTVNTVFTPKASISAQMDYGETGVFLSMVIQNGALDDFEALAARDGHDGLFECSDQGYETIKKNLNDYAVIAKQAAIVGIAVYAVILLLYLLLYPAMQSKTLKTMGSLGADRRSKTRYMLAAGLGILIPGTLLGIAGGALLWQRVSNVLQQSARVTLELRLDPATLLAIAGVQLLFATILTLLVSLPMTRNKSLMNKQNRIKSFFQRLRRTPLAGWSIVAFAAIIAVVLCSLHAANQNEYKHYEISVQEAPVTISLVNTHDNDPYKLNGSGFIMDMFYDTRFSAYTPMKYLTDFAYITSLETESLNYLAMPNIMLQLITSTQTLEENIHVTWLEGYDESCLAADTPHLLIPENTALRDSSPNMPGIQLKLLYDRQHEIYATVAGIYSGSENNRFYCGRSGMESYCEMLGIEASYLMKFSIEMFEYPNTNIIGITSHATPPNLSPSRNCVIIWQDSFDANCLDSGEEMFLLVPEASNYLDIDPQTPGTQVLLRFSNTVRVGHSYGGQINYEEKVYETIGTVAGTYTNSIDSRDIYCSFAPLVTCGARIGRSTTLDHVSAKLINNAEIADLRQMCNQWFYDPENPEMVPESPKGYTLVINDDTLENLAITLENSIAINEICTLLVFVLSAGAGFFLGFLMIRSRKREIILMRTLGKANFAIYIQYALEQMLCIVLGTALGGLVFQWQPVQRLGIFVGIYFLGLSAALILFLNSKLLTTVKEEE